MNTITSSVISHAIVAAAAAILSGVATWGGVNVVSSSMAQQTAQAGASSSWLSLCSIYRAAKCV